MRNASQKKLDYSVEFMELFTKIGFSHLNTQEHKKARILKQADK
jgi:hypothetical protein